MSTDYTAKYEELRQWYLARLRSLAIKRAKDLTPASLVKADRSIVERLMAEAAERQSKEALLWQDVRKFRTACLFSIWLAPVLVGILCLIFAPSKPLALFITSAAVMSAGIAMIAQHTVQAKLSGTICALLGESDQAEKEDLRRIESAVNTVVQKEKAIVDYASDVVFCLDSDGKILAINPACDALWGYPPYALIGKEISEIIHPDDLEPLSQGIANSMKAGVATFDCRIRCRNARLMDVTLAVEWSTTNQRLYCVARDVTPQKELDRVRREHVAIVSHDLRAPLTSIFGQITLLSEGAFGQLPETIRPSMLTIKKNTSRLINLVNDILDMEKLESGQLEFNCVWVEVSQLIKEAVDSVKALAESKSIEIKTSAANTKVYADPQRMVQVLVNLLSNAIKFSPAGGTVTLEAESIGGGVDIKLTDQGPGISEEDRAVVFERFKQLGVGSRDSSGLGLAICKGFVERHRGTIGVESELGKGSTFWVRIPHPLKQTTAGKLLQ